MNIEIGAVVGLVLGALVGWIARGHLANTDQTSHASEEIDGVSLISVTDPMTGLFNRQGYRLLAARLLREATREQRAVLLMRFHIDGLKAINDRLGETVGDEAITSAAGLLSATFRDTDLIARLDGDEFCVMGMLPGVPSDGSAQLARLDEAIKLYNDRDQAAFRLNLSGGLSTWDPHQPRSLEELEEEARRRLSADKVARGFQPAR
jgi:diguanylate cyclase (GGDEF)-like protein